MRLFHLIVPLNHQDKVVHLDRLSGEYPGDERRHLRASLRPDLEIRFPHGHGVLVAEDGRVAIIVEESLSRTPNDAHRLATGQKDADQCFQGLRPAAWLTKRGGGPVERAHQIARFPAVGEKPQRFAGERERARWSLWVCGQASLSLWS